MINGRGGGSDKVQVKFYLSRDKVSEIKKISRLSPHTIGDIIETAWDYWLKNYYKDI